MSMLASITSGSVTYSVNFNKPLDLSISVPTDFNHSPASKLDSSISVWNIPPAISKPLEFGTSLIDTRCGSGCNASSINYSPHTSGTHTECVGHITLDRISVVEKSLPCMMNAIVVTIETDNLGDCGDLYSNGEKDDKVISYRALSKAINGVLSSCNKYNKEILKSEFMNAVIIRTLPNNKNKINYTYEESIYFTPLSMTLLNKSNLICDLPSVDRLNNPTLESHRSFWELNDIKIQTSDSKRTITELAYIDESIKDGFYLLDLQIAPIGLDAATSRPIVYEVTF